MKKTLLEITQDVLNELDSDEVNGINDTIESFQVANIARSCYEEMIGNRDWAHLKTLGQLEASNDLNLPSHMYLPDKIKELIFVRYDKRKFGSDKAEYNDVKYLYPDEFLRFTSNRNNTLDYVRTVVDPTGIELFIEDNKAPSYWTSFNDSILVFDSYDKEIDDTLKKAKSQIYYVRTPVFEMVDDFIPDFPPEAFPGYIAEVKSTAFVSVKQMVNEKQEQKASRQQRWLSRKNWKAHGGVRYDNYGRRGKK